MEQDISTLTPIFWLKLALVPAAVWVASLAARRWGHAVSGYLGGMPMIGGPITLYLALDHGAGFAAQSALVTLAAIAGQAAHCILFAHVGMRFGWLAGLVSGWTGYGLLGLMLAHLVFPPWVGLLYALGGLLLAWRLLPRARVAPRRYPRFRAWSWRCASWPPSRSPRSSSGGRPAWGRW